MQTSSNFCARFHIRSYQGKMSCLLTILVVAATVSLGQGAVNWEEDLEYTEISEYLIPDDYIGTLLATETTDASKTFQYGIYRIIANIPSGYVDAFDYLEVDPNSGNVTVKALMDFEKFDQMKAEWGADTVRTTVDLFIRNENDNSPEFQDEPYSAEVSEAAEIGDSVTNVTAIDGDTGDTVSYELFSGPDCEVDHFRVGQTSGEIFVNGILDYASVVQFVVCVIAMDDEGRNDTTKVVISIRDAQNQPPVFIGQPYDKSIPEDTAVGEVVLTVVANDGDLGVNLRNVIKYMLIDDADGTFSVHITNGDIKVEKALDRDTDPITQLYTLIVQAIEEDDDDQPMEQINTNTSIYIRLSDVDDNPPTFTPKGVVNATIPEHSPRGTQLDFSLEAFDLDSGEAGRIILSLEDDEGIFYLVSETIFNSGVVDVRVDNSSALDFERISEVTFQIKASDAQGGNFSVVTATVYLTNINDNTPVFSQSQYDVSLPENSVENTPVQQLEATDADVGAELTFELLGYNNDWFNINSSTGYISVSDTADFNAELLSVYFLTCVVSDGERVSTALLNVTVTDVNDNPPLFQLDLYSVSIPEYNVDMLEEEDEGLNILQVLATDADINVINRMLTYSIESGNEEGKFDINSTTGMIFRKASIDRETEEATFEMVVMAIDGGTPSMNGTTLVTISIEDVNDNNPIFLAALYNAEVPENAAFGTLVANITAVDMDVDSLDVLYTIEEASPFLVNQEGLITLSGTVDYEIQMTYNLTVTATDREDTSRQGSCTVMINIMDVNDEPPEFDTPSPSSLSVNESAAYCDSLPGSDDCHVLITLQATDPDTNTDLRYSILDVKGYDENSRLVVGNFSDQFGVDSETGDVFVRTELDRETVQRFDVTVVVDDMKAEENNDTQTDSAELVITVLDVNDNAPEFIDLPDNFTTPETDQVGMVISVNILADDEDAEDNGIVIYELLDDAGGLVAISETTGILTVKQPIDKELNDSLTITFCAKDGGDPPLNTTVTRQIFITDVNDNTPVFNVSLPNEASILEDTTNGTLVLTVYATDADPDFGDLTYTISAGVGLEDFVINPENGDITVQNELDREEQALYTLTVVASDGIRQDNLEVTITILDVNDNHPEFTESFPESTTISETAEPGSSVAAIVAVDDDEPGTNNSAVRYIMTDENQSGFFKMDYVTGVVILNTTSTDALIPGVYVLVVVASDLGDPPLMTDPRNFSVIVTDYNDEAPVFVQPKQGATVYVDENYSGHITTAEATDGDLGDNGVVTFAFDTGLGATDDYKYFTIDETTGAIEITSETDRETKEIYILGIIGMNAKSDPIRSSQVTFYVQVNDTDDNEPAYWGERTGPEGPQDPPEAALLYVQENLGEGTFVGTVPEAVDLDSDLYNQIYYFIVSATSEDYFILDKYSGNLTLVNPIDREKRPEFSLVIWADSNPDYEPDMNVIYDPLKEDNLARVTVTVSDVNDSPPRFEEDRYTAGVLYSTSFGVEVITVNAVDPDLGENAVTVYTILSQKSYDADGNGGVEVDVFAINDGKVINSVTFQASDDSYYIVELQATDSLNPNFTDNATLSVYLMTEIEQVSALFADEPVNVRETQDDFIRLPTQAIAAHEDT
eukprot:XP_011673975.1 PREDICTED: cadherin-23 [Strongylocentrotus purpuratus]